MKALADRLPGPQALLVFEAAARHGSFTHAARELHVTQSAVSRRIRELEDELGHPLFTRTSRGVVPTARGRVLLEAVQTGFEQIAGCIEQAFGQPATAREVIRLAVPPSLATQWLVARLSDFAARNPGLRLQPDVGLGLAALGDDVAFGLRYGLGHYPDLTAVKLADEQLVAVCAPAVWPRRATPDALARLTWIDAYTETSPRPCAPVDAWQRHHGLDLAGPVLRFDRQSLAIVAAAEGQGVAIVPWQMVRDALALGTLIRPVPQCAPDAMSYHLAWQPGGRADAFADRLRTWLVDRFAGAPPVDTPSPAMS